MHLREIPTPTPGRRGIDSRCCDRGNFIDLYVRQGRYGNKLPFTSRTGSCRNSGCGRQSVSCLMKLTGSHGAASRAYAEYAVAPAERVVPIPIGVTFEQAAAVLLQGMTAHYLSHSAFPIQPGDEGC